MESLDSKVSVLDEKIKIANKRIDSLEEKTKGMPKLEVMMSMVIETNKDQTKTLNNINENITMLNEGQREMSERVGRLENDIFKNRIDWNEIFKKTIYYIFPLIIGIWILIQFGLK